MLKGIFKKLVGDANQKELDRLRPIVDEVTRLEAEYERLPDEALREFTGELRQRLEVETADLHSRLGRLRREFSFERDPAKRGRLGGEIERLQEALDELQESVLDEILPKAFAVVKEAAKRTIGESHFDVQIVGGAVIHQGKVAEMKTGEGKTLVATLPVYLNALTGRGVHVVTVNDYLARRDAVWMGPIYRLLGLSVGVLLEGENRAALYEPGYDKGEYAALREVDRRDAYAADVTYGTNHQFGFDYLRDNLVLDSSRVVQRGLNYAIVDEVDNIFIDEARTPLIISGPSNEPLEEYKRFAAAIRKLRPSVDYEVDAKERSVVLTEEGLASVERETGILDIYDEANFQYVHFMQQALNAVALYRRDRDYIVRGRRVVLVDHFTGRLMPDRKLSEGLHQAIEAKEGVPITPRNVVHATITIQNYFRMYRKLAGMTGTAASEAEEFHKIYGLEVVVIPTHKPMIREDHADVVYKNERAKWNAIVEEITECHGRGQPILVGTTSVEKSEMLAQRLTKENIKCSVLNAKRHAEEAKIIARAGEPGWVTIATSMAGRGVDIKLGGELFEDTIANAQRVLKQRGINPFRATPEQFDSAIAEVAPQYAGQRQKVLGLGGLHVLGTERHEARRIDNQLRGRSGRQGEPGSSRFFLSLEDDLMRRFGGSRVAALMDRVGLEEDIPIVHGLVDRSIESTQTRVEGYNFDIRKHLLEYDDVLDTQRKAIYAMRRRILDGESVSSDVREMIEAELAEQFSRLDGEDVSVWDVMARLDDWTFSVPAKGSPYHSSHALLGQSSCFPPLSFLMLADELAEMTPSRIRDDLLRRTDVALEHYLAHLLHDVMARGFEQTMSPHAQERRADRLRELSNSLDNQMQSYLDQTGEQGRVPNYRAMVQQIQRGFPVPLHVRPDELAGLDVDDARDTLLAAVERSFRFAAYENVVGWVQTRMPLTLQLGRAQLSDLDPMAWEEFVSHARQRAHSDETMAQIDELDRAVREPEEASQGRWLLAQVAQVGQWADIDFAELESLLRRIVEARYAVWSDQVRGATEKALDRSLDKRTVQECVHDVVQVLLDTFFVLQRVRTRSGQTMQSPVPLFPVHFLLAEEVGERDSKELHDRMLECLLQALRARESAWAEQELKLLGNQRLGDLEPSIRDDLVQYLGGEQLREVESARLEDLDEGVKKDVLFALQLQSLEDVRLAELGEGHYEELLTFLGDRLATTVATQRVAQLDAQTRQVIEAYLSDAGYFSDSASEARYMESKVGELDDDTLAGMARRVGRRFAEAHPDMPFGELAADALENLRQFFDKRRYFVDEEQVRRFFVSESLDDLGERLATRTTEYLARTLLEASHRRRLADLDATTRERIRAHMLRTGRFRDDDRTGLFPLMSLGDLGSATRDALLVRLGEGRLRLDEPMSQQSEEVREIVFSSLKGTGFFRDAKREKAVLGQRVSDLAEDVSELVTQRVTALVREQLGSLRMDELPADLRDAVYECLSEKDYFVDSEQSAKLLRQPAVSLDVQTLHGLEEHLGNESMLPLADVPVRELDRAVREDILAFMNQNGLLRKRRRREEFLESRLGEATKELYDSIAYHLGRSRLSPVRRTPLRDLPPDLQQQVWSYLRPTRYLLDKAKASAFGDQRLSDFGADLAEELEEKVGSLVLGQLRRERIGDLPEYLKSEVVRLLADSDWLLHEERVADFPRLILSSLDRELRERLLEESGRSLLAGDDEIAFEELSQPVREQVYAALDGAGYFTDQQALESFMQSRVEQLDTETLDDLVASLGEGLGRDIGSRPIASLSESMRRSIRAFLDEADAFVDDDRVRQFETQTFRGLGKDDVGEVAQSLGEMWLAQHKQSRLADLDADLKDATRSYLVGQGMFLDRSKLERFRSGTVDDLGTEAREAALTSVMAAWEEALRERTLAALPDVLVSQVREYLRESQSPTAEMGLEDIADKSVSELGPERFSYLAQYLGEQLLSRIENIELASVGERERKALRAFLGRRAVEDVEKDVLLTTTSGLWINYLTAIEDLRQGIGLQAYAQRDPLVEYKHRAYEMYQELQGDIRRTVVSRVFRQSPRRPQLVQLEKAAGALSTGPSEAPAEVVPSGKPKGKRRSRRRKKSR